MDQFVLYCYSAYLRLVAFACLLLVLLCNFFCIFKQKTPLSAKAREGMMVQVDPSNYRNFTSCNYGNSLNVKLALQIFPPFCICTVFHSLLRTFQFHIVSHFLHLFGIGMVNWLNFFCLYLFKNKIIFNFGDICEKKVGQPIFFLLFLLLLLDPRSGIRDG
jgi:hypothetical protein